MANGTWPPESNDERASREARERFERANHPTIHANRFEPEDKTPQQLEQDRRRRIMSATCHLSATNLKDFPKEMKYWGLRTQSHTYDSGYGDHGKPDMTTSYDWVIVVFDNEEALEDWVLDRVKNKDEYRIIRAEPVNTQVKAVFSIAK